MQNKLEVKASTIEEAGLGLFTTNVIEKGQLIVVYEGEHLTAEEMQARYPQSDACYVVQLSKNKFVDARNPLLSSLGRFANHQPRSKANAKLTATAKIIAKKRIHANEEIFITYGSSFRL
jgi:hypothetical protein